MARQLQVRPEQRNPLHDRLRAERASRLSAELDAAKQTQLQYEQSRFPADLLGTQRASELLIAQEYVKHIESSVALNAVREIQDRYNSVHTLAELSGLAAIAEAAIRSMKPAYIDQYFYRSFTGSILESLNLLRGPRGYEQFETYLGTLERSFEERIKAATRGTISFEGLLGIFIGIFVDVLLFILGLSMNDQSENRISQQFTDAKISIESHINSQQEQMLSEFRELKDNVLNMIDSLKPDQKESKVFYVTIRTVNLRSHSNGKSPVILELPQNQKVALITSKEKWIYVEYFDYINGIPKLGWVYGEYLKRLPEEGKR